MAADAEQQLSLVEVLGLQANQEVSEKTPTSPDPTAADDDQALMADAGARPRQRRQHALPQPDSAAVDPEPAGTPQLQPQPKPQPQPGHGSAKLRTEADEDLPAWHHHSLVQPGQLTPMLRHYVELKRAHPDRLLLYRLGDFFECFFEDAILVSRLLELTLTGKEGGKAIGRVPMAGIPHHAAERYCGELVRRGHGVALCDQVESTPARGELLRREITRVLTPGTVLDEGLLTARCNNWLAAVVRQGVDWGLAVADVSTGEFRASQRRGSAELHQELLQLEAAELLLPGRAIEDQAVAGDAVDAATSSWCPSGLHCTPQPCTPFAAAEAAATLRQRFGLTSLDGLGLGAMPLALRAAGGLVAYLDGTAGAARVPLDPPTTWHQGDALVLDAATRRNLELTRTQMGNGVHGSLLWALDSTLTAMGGRCLRRWVESPLVDRAAILLRQAAIAELVAARPLRSTIRRRLRAMGDLERLAGRCGAGTASARDLVALADGLERLPQLALLLKDSSSAALQGLARPWPELETMAARLRQVLVDAPPLSLSDGGLIHDGVDALLDGLRNQIDDQDAWLAEQEAAERRASGIATLKLQYHRSFGHFLAVSRARAAAVPDHWIRRQTLANEERFVTAALRNREGQILQLRARAAQREYELFCELRTCMGEQAAAVRTAARLVAELDCLASLAELAATNGYCCPEITDPAGPEARLLMIEAGRHPVVEQLLADQPFTPNSVSLGCAEGTGNAVGNSARSKSTQPDLIVLTGPNASGKSCYLRQVGLLQLMAQMGSWIPASAARLGITDRLFTRVGAADDLAAGQSTFMVEMAETANILHHASCRSLVLLDEIGRGTATFDGLAIAWAVAEHLAGDIGARSIFATHYHELNQLAELLPNVANAQVLVEETGESLLFLHRVVPGGASRSYGIEAARLAGVPATVVLRARQVLGRIEANSSVSVQLEQGNPSAAHKDPAPTAASARTQPRSQNRAA